ncbi:MAG: hypothetical protein Q8R83_08005 [Legionellaceae bacterium]|nr:hypothetical protein [Legionellaceae bacterium]
MASIFWDSSYAAAKEAEKAQTYKDYKTNLASRYQPAQKINYSGTPKERAAQWNQSSEQDFYAYSSLIRSEIQLDFEILQKMIADKESFNQLSSDAQMRIKYYYYDYALLLLDDARIPNHRADVKKYQKIIDDYNAELALTQKKSAEISNKLIEQNSKDQSDSQQKAEPTWFDKIINALKELAEFHPSVIIDWISYFNMYRLMVVFCRLTWKQLWVLGRALGWLDKYDNLFGMHVDIGLIDAPTNVFNGLSVFLFLGRLFFDLSEITRHFFFPTEGEKGVDSFERAQIEWNKRYARIVNDIAWALFNSLTNYAIYFGIPIPVAGWLLVGFLFFDIALLAYQLHVENKKQSVKKQALTADLAIAGNNEDKAFIYLQLKQLEYRRVEIRAKFIFYMAAASLLVLGFILSLSLTALPVSWPICFFLCVCGIGMYLSAGQFSAAVRASKERESNPLLDMSLLQSNPSENDIKQVLSLDKMLLVESLNEQGEQSYQIGFNKSGQYQQMLITDDKLLTLLKAYDAKNPEHINAIEQLLSSLGATRRFSDARLKAERAAWKGFAFNLVVENIIVPMVIVGLFTVCWPAALALTVLYIGIKHGNLSQLSKDVGNFVTSKQVEETGDETKNLLACA